MKMKGTYIDDKPNYEKYPIISLPDSFGRFLAGWEDITAELNTRIKDSGCRVVLVVEYYQGLYEDELSEKLSSLEPDVYIHSRECFKSEKDIREMTWPDVTDDRLFGFRTRLTIDAFFDRNKLEAAKRKVEHSTGLICVRGPGSVLLAPEPDILVYADMPRWEIQQRFRAGAVDSLGVEDRGEGFEPQYKRGWFVDWRVLDRHKRNLIPRWDYFLDTTKSGSPVMAGGDLARMMLDEACRRPFRMVPYFDPGPWGGQWIKEVCDMDPKADNYAWCIDCVMEDESVCFGLRGTVLEMPANNIVLYRPKELLGDPVYARFGNEFPIRFDFLDTMDGGNLSLQVHPMTQYVHDTFGCHYTQDESYYILDAAEGAKVYLGLKTGIEPKTMIDELRQAERGEIVFDADKHAQSWPAKKHDHFLIPGGTVHCSGRNCMVLEISSNIYMFTFKLWDWGRLGLDGRPRPINIDHGEKNIQWYRTTEWTGDNLINRIEETGRGDGWVEERTGLHEMEFIETRRRWFSTLTHRNTGGLRSGSCHVINLVEGREVCIESETNTFPPLILHYAETVVIPAVVGPYTVKPWGDALGTTCGTITASIRVGL